MDQFFTAAITFEEIEGQIVPAYPYWQPSDQPMTTEESKSYKGAGLITSPRNHVWNHTIAEVLNALIGNGLRIDRLEEHPEVEWKLFPSVIPKGPQYVLPESLRDKLPVCWTIVASRT